MFNNESKLSRMVQQQAVSFEYHSHILNQMKGQLRQLKKDNISIAGTFQHFCKETNDMVADWVRKICSFLYRQLKEKHYLESELEKSKVIQQNMRSQVMNLKEMIQTAIQDYERQIQDKDTALKQKNTEIQILIKQLRIYEQNTETKHDKSVCRMQESRKIQNTSLQIIQEESEQATYSSQSQATIRDKDERIDERILPSTLTNHIQLKQLTSSQIELSCNPVTIEQSENECSQKENSQQKHEHKRTKSFIDHFRKTIEQSFSQKNEESIQHIKSQSKSPLQEIRLNEVVYSNPKQFSHNLKECAKEVITFKTLFMHAESNQISKCSSNSDLIVNNQAQRINIPKKFQTPPNLIFFKKNTPTNRVMTEPSPQRPSKHENNYFSSKPSNSQKRIFHEKKSSCQKSRSNHSIDDSKSMKSSLSKEKIKITAKMVDEYGVSNKKGPQSKALVYLGGKSIFRKFLIELKCSLKQYSVYNGSFKEEIKYQGQRKNGMKWGSGRLIYQNGSIYEGEFKQNMRHGRGSLSLNGIQIYQGLWLMDKMHGEGYIKSMKYMSKSCPSIFNQASYCGNLHENKLHGIGTIFLNSKQKIVTKFLNGVPIGDLTYYNFHQIEFGVWPTQ